MERLETKTVKGHTYYYYSKWAWVDGRCRRVWQRYLGKLEDIVQSVEGGRQPACAEVFQFALPQAMWKQCQRANVISLIDQVCSKRKQGMSTGQYLAVAALNRAMCPESKRAIWEWFSQTVLLRHLPGASEKALTSQRFWDHMHRMDPDACAKAWKAILSGVVDREQIDLSQVSYDGTNFYTFIDTFNVRCQIAKRGKNKQGRGNLRQVSYALFCCADGQLPLYYDAYEGNRNDTKQFPQMIRRFHQFFQGLGGLATPAPQTTVIFDKGNNSKENFQLLDELKLKFVGSVKLDEHRELTNISNGDSRFRPCANVELEGTKAFRVKKTVAGRERVLVVTYNQNLFDAQCKTVLHDLSCALDKLSELRGRLEDRAAGLIQGGRAPSVASVEKQCGAILSRQHMKQIIRTEVFVAEDGLVRLSSVADASAFEHLCDTYLGKTLIISNRDEWDDDRLIRAYRSQYIIEGIFKDTKDRRIGTWWPMYHWTDSKIHVHAFYCTVAILLRSLLLRRVRQSQVKISLARLLKELEAIREVVNIYPRRGRQGRVTRQTTLTKTTALQKRLLEILELDLKPQS